MARTVDTERRREIAAQAFEVVRSRGVHRATMSDIAAALDMKRPTLYWYFSDLGEIFDAVLDLNLTELAAFVADRLSGIAHPLDRVEAYLRAMFDFYRGREDTILVLLQFWAVGEGPGQPERAIARMRAYFEPWRAMAVADLQRGIDDGRVAPCNPEAVVDLVGIFIDGGLIHRVGRGIELEPAIDLLRETVLEPLRIEESGKAR